MLNKATLIGHLGADPEIKSVEGRGNFATFTIATSESWKDKSTGEKKEKTEWHRVVIFNDHLAGIVDKYVRKGSKVYIEGSLQTRKWQDQSGADRYTTEIVLQGFNGVLKMLDSRQSGEQGMYENKPQQGHIGAVSSDLDDEIPF